MAQRCAYTEGVGQVNQGTKGRNMEAKSESLEEYRARVAPVNLKVGDVLVARWGYDMILNTFVEVVKVSASGKSVSLRELKSEVVSSDGFLAGREVPKPGVFKKEEEIMVRRVGEHMKLFSWGAFFHKWDGEPCSFDHCD